MCGMLDTLGPAIGEWQHHAVDVALTIPSLGQALGKPGCGIHHVWSPSIESRGDCEPKESFLTHLVHDPPQSRTDFEVQLPQQPITRLNQLPG